jgi:phosphomannomutase
MTTPATPPIKTTDRHDFHPTILREYDIRGIVGATLFEADAGALGRAFGSVVVARFGANATVCVGYDGRLTSPELEAALCQGLASTGVKVVRIGLGPTPLLYFAVHHLDADGGVMVTGSHNPPEHNGFKLMLGKKSFYGADITALGVRAAGGDFVRAAAPGEISEQSLSEPYLDVLAGEAAGAKGLASMRVAWDAGNGAGGAVMAALCGRLAGEHVLLNAEIDGTFPNHHPDPTVAENLRQIQDVIRDQNLDLGIALDGDGDRIGVVDGTGRILWADQLMALLARDVLRENPGSTLIADVKSSQMLFDEIARLGGRPIMWKTGHSLVKDKMAEESSPFAGELSGHIFFADRFYGFDDALYVAVRLLVLLGNEGKSLAELADELPRLVNTPEIRLDCDDARKFDVVEEIRQRLTAAGAAVNSIDGVRVQTDDGWWLLRASNTQAALVARCEAADDPGLARLKQALRAQLELSEVASQAV